MGVTMRLVVVAAAFLLFGDSAWGTGPQIGPVLPGGGGFPGVFPGGPGGFPGGPGGPQSAVFNPGVRCPDNRISYNTCVPGSQTSCNPPFVFFCYTPPFGGQSACCRRPRNCPTLKWVTCVLPGGFCRGDFNCQSNRICCASPCGRKCVQPFYKL